MKILHIDETFHPSYGYHVNPLAKFQQMQGHNVTIMTVDKEHLYPVYKEFGDDGSTVLQEDEEYSKATGVKIVRVHTKGYFLKRAVYSSEMFKMIDDIQPDVIFVHCVETLTGMRFLIRKKRYPLMFDSHMLSMASMNRFVKVYEWAFHNFLARIIRRHGYYVIRTQDDDYINSHLGIPASQTPFISFGTDTILFQPSEEVRIAFRAAYGIEENDFVILYTGKLTEAKGGKLLAEAFTKPLDTNREVVLVIVGTPPENNYGCEVQALLDQAAVRVVMFPTQKYADLAKFYQMADLSVFPKQCSMSFYDAQACGLPVVSEDNNINVDRCSHGNGSNFKSGDVENFRSEMTKYANMDPDDFQQQRDAAITMITNRYGYDRIAEEYTDYLKASISMENKRNR